MNAASICYAIIKAEKYLEEGKKECDLKDDEKGFMNVLREVIKNPQKAIEELEGGLKITPESAVPQESPGCTPTPYFESLVTFYKELTRRGLESVPCTGIITHHYKKDFMEYKGNLVEAYHMIKLKKERPDLFKSGNEKLIVDKAKEYYFKLMDC